MWLNIVSPHKQFFNGEVISVQLPGTSGSFQVLNNHAPIIATLIAGTIKVEKKTDVQFFLISGGVVEVTDNKIIVLAEYAEEDIQKEILVKSEEDRDVKQRLEDRQEEEEKEKNE